MKLRNKLLHLAILVLLPFVGLSQKLRTNVFIRTPQVVNYNLNQGEASYSPVMSLGVGLSHQSKFIELATFINGDDIYGFYTFFGKVLKARELSNNLSWLTSWFGEVTFLPRQNDRIQTFTYTTGLCFSLNYGFEWGSIGIPLCIGIAYSEKATSLNTRTILNLSLNL